MSSEVPSFAYVTVKFVILNLIQKYVTARCSPPSKLRTSQ